MANITGKYFNKIRKDIIEYSDCIINYVYNTPSKYKNIAKGIIKIYVEKYSYEKEIDFNNVYLYFPNCQNVTNKIKYILQSIIEYHQEEKTIKNLENNQNFYLSLSLVIWLATELHLKVNPLEEKLEYKEIVTESVDTIHKVFSYTKDKEDDELKINLLNKVKENYHANKDFFEIMLDNKIYNQFSTIDTENKFYEVNYKYEIAGLEEFKINEVQELKKIKGINNKYFEISLELLTLTILKQQIKGINRTYYYRLSLDYYSQTKNTSILDKISSIPEIKQKVVFIADYEEYMNNRILISEVKNAGYTIALDNVPAIEYKNYNIFADSKMVFITEKFLEINRQFVSIWQGRGVTLAIKSDKKRTILLEEDMLKE